MSTTGTLHEKIQSEVVELASSIKDIVDKFKQLHAPLAESKETVPKATEQLDKVSKQTEAAAHQMLDRIEKITERDQQAVLDLKTLKENPADADKLIDGIIEKVEANCNDAYMIMDALQFQDITAQQMDHAASLLDDIELKLIGIVGVLDGDHEKVIDGVSPVAKKKRAFDPHADMFESKTNQDDIDSLVQNNRKDI